MKTLAAAALLLLLVAFVGDAAAEPRNLSCLHAIGPPGNWCPKCSAYPNYLFANRVDPVEGPCLRCYLGCSIQAAKPDTTSVLAKAEDPSEAVCHVKADLTLSEIEADSLVSLEVDADALAKMAQQFPISASMIAVLHSTGDPLPVLERLNEFQIQFRDRPGAQSALDYFNKKSPAAALDIPDDSDVLTTAKSSQLGQGNVLLEIQSELRSAMGSNLVVEGPVYVELTPTGKRSDYEYGNVTIHPPILKVGSVSGLDSTR